MADRDSVIKGLYEITHYSSEQMFYNDIFIRGIADDALALLKERKAMEQCLKTKCVMCPHCDNCDVDENGLLKEQEAVEPEVYYVSQDNYKFYRCPVCKIDWHYKGNYCYGCGRPVKWE